MRNDTEKERGELKEDPISSIRKPVEQALLFCLPCVLSPSLAAFVSLVPLNLHSLEFKGPLRLAYRYFVLEKNTI